MLHPHTSEVAPGPLQLRSVPPPPPPAPHQPHPPGVVLTYALPLLESNKCCLKTNSPNRPPACQGHLLVRDAAGSARSVLQVPQVPAHARLRDRSALSPYPRPPRPLISQPSLAGCSPSLSRSPLLLTPAPVPKLLALYSALLHLQSWGGLLAGALSPSPLTCFLPTLLFFSFSSFPLLSVSALHTFTLTLFSPGLCVHPSCLSVCPSVLPPISPLLKSPRQLPEAPSQWLFM